MARYGRRRSSYRRAGRRGRRTLSTRSIFNNKGARAQAGQISALKKRINYVYRQCRPETKLKETNPIELRSARDDETPYLLYSVDMPNEGVGDNAMVGNVCNVKDVHLALNCELDENWTTTTYAITGDLQITCDYRVVAFALKSTSDTGPNPDDIGAFYPYNSTFRPYYFMNAIRPLNEGVSAYIDILYDRRFRISNQTTRAKTHNLKIHGGRIKKYIDSQYMTYGKASMWVLIIPVLQYPSVIETADAPPASPEFVCRIMDKIAYTDP